MTTQPTIDLIITSAPAAYDGFGTYTIASSGTVRLVSIHHEHLGWQTGRYASGTHYHAPALLGATPAAERAIVSDVEHDTVLARIDAIIDAPDGSPEAIERAVLARVASAYEEIIK
jgi:hypothetical protein